MNKNFVSEDIDKLGVYELREVARRLGVASPTTKKIKQLKDEIAKIYNGEIVIKPQEKRLGRPPKSIKLSDDEYSNVLIPRDITDIVVDMKNKENSEELALKKLLFKFEGENFFDDEKQMTNCAFGYLRKTAQNHSYFWKQANQYFIKDIVVYVPDTLVSKYCLRVGDLVEVEEIEYTQKNCAVASFVLSINGEQIGEDFERTSPIDMTQFCLPSSPITIFDECVLKGGRALVVFDDRTSMAIKSIEKAKELSKETKVVFVGCEIPPELFSYVSESKDNIRLFVSRFGDGLESSYNVIINAINHAQTLVADKSDVVVLVYDIMGLVDIMKLYFESKGVHPSSGSQLIKSLFGLGRCFEKDATITTVATLLKNEYGNDFIEKELGKVATCVIGKY